MSEKSDSLKDSNVQIFVVPNCREAIAAMKNLIGPQRYRQADSIAVFGYEPVNNASQVSNAELKSLRAKTIKVPMDFDVYCRRGLSGYFYTERQFLANGKQTSSQVKKVKKNREQTAVNAPQMAYA